MNSTAAAGGGLGFRPPFTASQWEELEHQALIFKYLIAGMPVPSELLLPIRRSFESIASRLYHHHPAMGYCSYYGKKLDPEPGRCRRTDGKKWRCSKDAYPDSKYCERHMHRGRNRSRKLVETPQAISGQSPSCCSTPPAISLSSIGSSAAGNGRAGAGSAGGNLLPALPLNSSIASVSSLGAVVSSHLNLDQASYGNLMGKDFR